MSNSKLEVADIFRRHGEAWRAGNTGHVSHGQLRVMSAIEACRTATLGGHVERCEDCAHTRVAYNSCRNRHCPKCQWTAAQAWLEAREAELLQCRTSTWCSRCRPRSAPSPIRTRPRSTASCSRQQPRH